LAMLIKPGSKFFAVAVCLYFAKTLYRNLGKRSMLPIYASLFIIACQLWGMKKKYGDYTISYIDGVTCYNYLCNRAVSLENGSEFKPSARASEINSVSYSTAKKRAISDLYVQIAENPENLAKAYFIDVYDNTKSGNSAIDFAQNVEKSKHFNWVKTLLYHISKWQNRLFTILGLLLGSFYLWMNFKTEKATAVAAFFILYVIATSGISSNEGDRFHLVAFPFTMILLAKYYTEKKRPA